MDYLNEYIMWTRTRPRDGTYRRALALKMRGDAVIFNQLAKEWISRFKWTVPKENGVAIAPELIERYILFDGMAGFRKVSTEELVKKSFAPLDESGKYGDVESQWRMFCVSGTDNLSFYGYPTRAYLTDRSGQSYGYSLVQEDGDVLNREDMCVLVMNSPLCEYPIMNVLYYAEKLSMIETSINAAVQNILGTSIIECDAEQEKQIIKERKAAQMGVPWVIRRKGIYKAGEQMNLLVTEGSVEALKTLYEAQNKIHADYLQSIGIKANNEVDKKSGVTPLEIVQSRQNVDLILNNAYEQRLKAVEQLKKAGVNGINVSVDNFETKTPVYDASGNKIEDGGEGKSDPEKKEGEK